MGYTKRIQEAKQFPHSTFWVQKDRLIYQRALKAIKNTNLNRTSRIEILWSELETGAIETENIFGLRTIFFLRTALISSSEDEGEPSDPLDDLDDMAEINSEAAANSDEASTEPLPTNSPPHSPQTPATGPTVASANEAVQTHNLEAITREEHHFRLDADFEQELNDLGLTCLLDHPICICPRPDTDAREGPSK